MYMAGFPTEYAPGPMFHSDGKLALNTNVAPHTVAVPQGVGLGFGVGLPPTPLSGTLPPALLGRSPMTPGSGIIPVSTSTQLRRDPLTSRDKDSRLGWARSATRGIAA